MNNVVINKDLSQHAFSERLFQCITNFYDMYSRASKISRWRSDDSLDLLIADSIDAAIDECSTSDCESPSFRLMRLMGSFSGLVVMDRRR
jgi:hypothetical protein